MHEIIKHILDLRKQRKDLEAEEFLIKAIEKDPNNTDLLLRLALVEMYSPFGDFDKSLECLNQILEYDSKNIKALLLLAYLQRIRGYTEDELIDQLSSINTKSNDIKSMIEYAKALYYQTNDNEAMYEQSLTKSVKYYKHVWNCVRLGKLYLKQGKITEGKQLLKTALDNVRVKYTEKNLVGYDSTDINNFLDSQIKGIAIAEVLYLDIQDYLMHIKS